MARSYWLDLFTGTTWDEFLAAGGKVSGFREGRWSVVQKIKPGDYLLCYLTGLSRFIAILEVTEPAYRDSAPIWAGDTFPCRLGVEIVEALTPATAVPILGLRERLTIFENLKNPNVWQGAVRGSPTRWKSKDGEAVVSAILEAKAHPVERPVDLAKYNRQPAVLTSKRIGEVTVPDTEEEQPMASMSPSSPGLEPTAREGTAHTEIQWLLLRLGSEMGLGVWAARGDRGKDWGGRRFDSLPNFLSDLPLPFDAATNKIIENIDVLWLQGSAFQAAFEIESTTSIYSGLLRMSDLLSMQPNLNIPLFLVAPDERRDKVISEVNRATFSRLQPPLTDVCRYISFASLREHLAKAEAYLRYLRPDFLQEISEPCAAGR